jgi:hypothetical protein
MARGQANHAPHPLGLQTLLQVLHFSFALPGLFQSQPQMPLVVWNKHQRPKAAKFGLSPECYSASAPGFLPCQDPVCVSSGSGD